MLKGAGGILTKCKRTFSKELKNDPNYTFQWKEKDNKFVFYKIEKDENGKRKLIPTSEIYLKHSEHAALIEEYWQSVEASYITLDEATQYDLPMVNYIMSRMRNPSCESVKPRLKMTCNPMNTHFLRKWVEPYLKEDGTPDRTKDGLIRYFQMYNGDFYFADTKDEVVEYVGCAIEDVLSFTFISATVVDNAILQKIDPRYVSWLKGLKGIDRARLLEGNWFAREDSDSYFDRSSMVELEEAPPRSEFTKIVRAYDFAGTMPSDTNRNPDYTVSVKMGKLKTGEYVILDITKTRIGFGGWLSHILDNAGRDGKHVEIVIPQDPNIQAKANAVSLARQVIEHQYSCTTKRAAAGKLEDFKPFAAAAQLGIVQIVKGCGNDLFNKIYDDLDFFYQELEVFNGKRSNKKDGHDDAVDGVSLAFLYLASKVRLGNTFLSGVTSAKSNYVNPLIQIN